MRFFGIISTLIMFFIFYRLKSNKFFKKIPIIVSVGLVLIFILQIFKIDYGVYYQSANILSFMIAPATIALAYPMYKNSDVLIKNKRALYPSLILGTIVAIISTYILAKVLGAEFEVIMSLIPKSTTMPIALEISKSLGGYAELTACIVAITGIFGGVFGHGILKFLKVKNDVAIGLALGSASHVIGTAACVEKKKEKQIAASTIALILVGIFTTLIVPLFKGVLF